MPAGKRIRFRTLALAAVFVATLTGVVTEVSRRPQLGTFRLPEGGTLSLKGVTFGRGSHRFIEGNTLHQWLGGLPRRVLETTGARVNENNVHPTGSDPEKLMVWGSAQPAWEDPFEKVYLTLSDEHGCEVPYSGGSSGSGVRPWVFTFFSIPRTGSRLKVRAYDRMSWDTRLIGEVEIDNPAEGTRPPLTPEPLPATRRLGEIACTLTDLEWERPSSDLWGPPTKLLRAWFRVTRGGAPAPDQRIQEVRLGDGGGDELSWGARPAAYGAGPGGLLLARGRFDLCRRLPAFELKVRLEDSSPRELPTVVIPLPPGRAARPLGASVGNLRFTEVRAGATPGDWVLSVEGGGPTSQFPYTVEEGHDDRNRPVDHRGSSTTVGAGLMRHTVHLAASPGARELTLRLRPLSGSPGPYREARFVVAPPLEGR